MNLCPINPQNPESRNNPPNPMTPENAKLVADLSKEIPRDSLTANDLKRSNLIRAIDAIKALSMDNEWLRKHHLDDEDTENPEGEKKEAA